MASEAENKSAEKAPAGAPATKKSNTMLFAIVGVGVVALAGGGGLLAAKMMSGPSKAAAAPAPEPAPAEAAAKTESREFDYYEMDPITVNLNEPRLARWVRVSVTLAMESSDKKSAAHAKELLEGRKNELRNWLTVFLAGCSLEDVRGAKNLNRLQREIMDSFNQQLWPDQKPLIHHVLFKEFAVQ